MRVLLLATAYNGLTQRIHRELLAKSVEATVELAFTPEAMIEAAKMFAPDIIICPFLKQKVPPEIYNNYKCLIVHPGIAGDRGPSSLDWAITDGKQEWGVTLLEAVEEMDAGDIWGTCTYAVRPDAAKAGLYRRETGRAASQLVHAALEDLKNEKFCPRPLNYDDPTVQGTLRPLMQQDSRKIEWQQDTTEHVLTKLRAADSFPGVVSTVPGQAGEIFLFGGVRETKLKRQQQQSPGDIIGVSQGAVCFATTDGAVWVRQMKRRAGKGSGEKYMKLPSVDVLGAEVLAGVPVYQVDPLTTANASPVDFREVRYEQVGSVGYLYFDFYNGAMNTQHCSSLAHTVASVKNLPAPPKVLVLMGGEDFFGNGIHLCCIENAENPAAESWANINAMDDFVKEVLEADGMLTVAAFRNNAGAGSVFVGLACDKVVAREGVVLNPHYKTMGLYGSEYWTHSLPKRVGAKRAEEITEGCLPMVASEAVSEGVCDLAFPEDWDTFHNELRAQCAAWASDPTVDALLAAKPAAVEELGPSFEACRKKELAEMRGCMFDNTLGYHEKRQGFVYKRVCCKRTPARIALHRKTNEA